MMTTNQLRLVTGLRMPICHNGFRSGYAYALVAPARRSGLGMVADGPLVWMRLHTSRSDQSDYYAHQKDVYVAFANGEGEACK